MKNVIIIAGSTSDSEIVEQLRTELIRVGVVLPAVEYASAHRDPLKVLEILKENPKSIFITIAGLSNALSGMVAANCKDVVIAMPVFKDATSYLTDIHSTLRMPGGVPVLTVLSPKNCAEAVARILDLT